MKKCFLLCEVLLALLALAGCDGNPVYIADEIDVDQLWTIPEDGTEIITGKSEPVWDGVTVYYTESGSVWHISSDCSALNGAKSILSGTPEQAQREGKDRACKKCS